MDPIVEITAQFIQALRLAYARKWSFLGLFAIFFVASTSVLALADLLPEAPKPAPATAPVVASVVATTTPIKAEAPTKIEVASLGLVATIANPESTDIKVLDGLLLRGAVRYPTSAKLGEAGNVVLFGHSSYLPIVNNQAMKTFNGIQKLKQGDTITVYSSGTAYTYAVRTVAKESAKDAEIPLIVSGRVLTLATCNSFGEKSDRFVVTADFVESHLLGA